MYIMTVLLAGQFSPMVFSFLCISRALGSVSRACIFLVEPALESERAQTVHIFSRKCLFYV